MVKRSRSRGKPLKIKHSYINPKYNKLVIKKKLAYGMMGTVFLCKTGEVLKIQHVRPKDLKRGGSVYNDLAFSKVFGDIPGFIQMLDYKIEGDKKNPCKHVQKYPFPAQGKWAKELKKIAESPMCLYKVMPFIDGVSLQTANDKKMLTKKDQYQILYQLVKLSDIMRKKGWVHQDLHRGNIMISKKKHKTTDPIIKKSKYFVYIIDYEMAFHKSWKLKGQEKELWENHGDILWLLTAFNNHNFQEELQRLNKKHGEKFPIDEKAEKKVAKEGLKLPEVQSVLKIKPKLKVWAFLMAQILYPDKIAELFKKLYGKYADGINFKTEFLIDKADWIMMLMMINHPEAFLDYIRDKCMNL